jgi:hypothetical protein
MNDVNLDQPPYRDSYRPEFDPIGGTWYFRINATGEVAEVSVLVLRADEWNGRREATDSQWRPLNFGNFIVAVKALC